MPVKRRTAKKRGESYDPQHVYQLESGLSPFEFVGPGFGWPEGEMSDYSTFFRHRLYTEQQLAEMRIAWPILRAAVFEEHAQDESERRRVLPWGWWMFESKEKPSDDWWNYFGQSDDEIRFGELAQLKSILRTLPNDCLAIVKSFDAIGT